MKTVIINTERNGDPKVLTVIEDDHELHLQVDQDGNDHYFDLTVPEAFVVAKRLDKWAKEASGCTWIAEVKSELEMLVNYTLKGYHFQPLADRPSEYFHNEISLWFQEYPQPFSAHYTRRHRDFMALTYICVVLGNKVDDSGIKLVLEERQRQISRGFTIARDKATYKDGDELRRFAWHRFSGLDKHYPFRDDSFKNSKVNHTPQENLIQAGALLLAQIQKDEAWAQFQKLQKEMEAVDA